MLPLNRLFQTKYIIDLYKNTCTDNSGMSVFNKAQDILDFMNSPLWGKGNAWRNKRVVESEYSRNKRVYGNVTGKLVNLWNC